MAEGGAGMAKGGGAPRGGGGESAEPAAFSWAVPLARVAVATPWRQPPRRDGRRAAGTRDTDAGGQNRRRNTQKKGHTKTGRGLSPTQHPPTHPPPPSRARMYAHVRAWQAAGTCRRQGSRAAGAPVAPRPKARGQGGRRRGGCAPAADRWRCDISPPVRIPQPLTHRPHGLRAKSWAAHAGATAPTGTVAIASAAAATVEAVMATVAAVAAAAAAAAAVVPPSTSSAEPAAAPAAAPAGGRGASAAAWRLRW